MAETSLKQIEAARQLAPEATACLRPVLETLYRHGQNASAAGDDAAVQFGVDVTEKLVPVAAALAAKAAKSAPAEGPATAEGPGPGPGPVLHTRGFADDEILCSTASPVSFASPRGKFVVHCLRDRFALESTTGKGTTTHVVRHEHVRRLLYLQRGDSNDTKDVLLSLAPGASLTIGKQSVATLLAQCRGKDKPVEIIARREMGLDPRLDSSKSEQKRDAGEALVAMMEMASGVAEATRPKTSGKTRDGFAGVGGRGCVKANVKFNQGFLFCLPDGFAFVDRPALYLPFDDLADLQLARAEGVGSSFDLIVSRVGEPTSGNKTPAESRSNRDAFEFANISREELDGVRRYLAKNCSEKGEGEEGGKNAESDDDDALDARSDDDDDSDDEDFGVAREDEEESDDDDDSESDDDDDDEEEEEEASDSEEDSADGAGRKRARDEIPAATSSPAPAAGEDSEEEEEEEEEEDDSDEDGAFEVVPVAKTARR